MSQPESDLAKQCKALKLELKIIREQKKSQEDRFKGEIDELSQMVRDEVNKSIRYKVELEKFKPTVEEESGLTAESPDRKNMALPRWKSLMRRKSSIVATDTRYVTLEAEIAKTKKELKETQQSAIEQAKVYEKKY